jgi:hypothetical protein
VEEVREESDKAARANAADAAICRGKVAEMVHNKAVLQVPRDVGLRMRMLQATAQVPCDGTAELQAVVLDSFLEDLGQVWPCMVLQNLVSTD